MKQLGLVVHLTNDIEMEGEAVSLVCEVRPKFDTISFQTPTVGPMKEQLI